MRTAATYLPKKAVTEGSSSKSNKVGSRPSILAKPQDNSNEIKSESIKVPMPADSVPVEEEKSSPSLFPIITNEGDLQSASTMQDHETKYVGTEARSLFFDRMKFMSHHNQISTHKTDHQIVTLNFEHNDKMDDTMIERLVNNAEGSVDVEPTSTRIKLAALPTETPRSIASLIMNSALPPIVIAGPSRGKSIGPLSRSNSKSPSENPPLSTPSKSKFDFNMRSRTPTKSTGMPKKIPTDYHYLASLALVEEDDDGERSAYQSVKLQASLSRLSSLRELDATSQSPMSISHSPVNRPLSPRSKFISKCLEKKMHPRASVILRKGINQKLMNLQHMSLGNDMISVLAECLTDLPYGIEAINLDDNGLDGKSIAPLIQSLRLVPTITSLNLSHNTMDKASINALAEYFKYTLATGVKSTESLVTRSNDNSVFGEEPKHSLTRLYLEKTEIDDVAADKILQSLQGNTVLAELDLSNNKIGSSENRRSVQANYLTFTEGLAQLLKLKTCPLKSLNLSWNTIRQTSAVAIAKCLAFNKSLTHLDLSFNSIGSDAGEQLGDSLLDNQNCLQTLVLTQNNINSSAAFALAIGVMESKNLRKVVLDDNPIGESGARSLMLVPMSVGGRVKLSLTGCNITIKENSTTPKGTNKAGCWFNPSDPVGTYSLDLTKPYDRAVAFAVLQIAANHSTFIIQSAVYEREKNVFEELELIQTVTQDHDAILDDRQRKIVDQLKKICVAASDVRRAKELFKELDSDNSGEIDKVEFQKLLGRMGIEVASDWIDDVMKPYDLDESGNIDITEFVAFLNAQYEEATGRINDLTQTRVMNLGVVRPCSSKEGSSVQCITPSARRPWEMNSTKNRKKSTSAATFSSKFISPTGRFIPPRSGILHVKLVDGFYKKPHYSTVRTFDHFYAREVASSMESGTAMMEHAIKNAKLRLSEAVALYYSMDAENSAEPMTILAKLVVLLDDPYDAKKMIRRMTKGDKARMIILKKNLGYVMRPVLGQFNGFYSLELNKEFDRMCLSRLFEHNYTCMQQRQTRDGYSTIFGGTGIIGDTSQIFDKWSCFRNVVYNDETTELPSSAFFPIPQTGKLCFDFSSTSRPTLVVAPGIEAIAAHSVLLTDMRCIKILRRLFNFNIEQVAHGLEKLEDLRKTMKKNNKESGNNYYSPTKEIAQSVGRSMDEFFGHLIERGNLIKEAVENEIIKVDIRRAQGSKFDKIGQADSSAGGHTPIVLNPVSAVTSPSASMKPLALARPTNLLTITENAQTATTPGHRLFGSISPKNKTDASSSPRGTIASPRKAGFDNSPRRTGIRTSTISPKRISMESPHRSMKMFGVNKSQSRMDTSSSFIGASGNIVGVVSEAPPDPSTVYDFDIVKRKSFKAGHIHVGSGTWAPVAAGAHYVVPKRIKKTMSTLSAHSTDPIPEHTRGVMTRKGTEDVIFEHALTNKGLSEDVQNLRNIINSSSISQHAKSFAVLEMLLDILGSCNGILCRHIVMIISYCPWASTQRANYFGSYHVELIVALFPRIADLYNFEMVMKCLSPQDCAALYCRIGWLNIFNPMKMDGFWELSFGRYEERQIIKILITSSKLEAGDNWPEKSFRWQRSMDEVPAWDLTVTYLADVTCPNKGILLVKYSSGDSKTGYKPNIPLRKALMSMVLLDEDDQAKVEAIDNEDEIDEEEEENIDAKVITTKNDPNQVILSPKLISAPTATVLGLGTTESSNTAPAELREGEKFIAANKSWWDTLLIFSKVKKSVYGTHGTRLTHINALGV